MTIADNILNNSGLGDYTAPPSSPSTSAISSISDMLSVTESASAVDPIDSTDRQKSLNMGLKAQMLKPHSRYYMRDGMIDIGIGDTGFRIPRSILVHNSLDFSKIIQALDDSPEPNSILFIEDEDVTAVDFERLLEVLYPLKFGEMTTKTLEEWTSVLHLASKWSFHAIRDLAIERLAAVTSPVDRVVLGRNYDIQEWLFDAYTSLCERPEPLTLEEGRKMTTDDIILISEARHRVRVYSGLVSPEDMRAIVNNLFGEFQVTSNKPQAPVSTPESPPEASAPQVAEIAPVTPSSVTRKEAPQPLDLTRVSRLMKTLAGSRSDIAKAGLKELILPHCSQPDTMNTVLKLLSEQIVDSSTSYPDSLAELAVSLSQVIDPRCTDRGTPLVLPGEALSGSSWLTHQLVSYCNTTMADWTIFEGGSNWDPVYRMTSFLSTLVGAGLLRGDVFVPCWEAILRSSERPTVQWASHLSTYFCDRRPSIIHTHSCSLLIDDFYHRIELRLAELNSDTNEPGSKRNIQRSLRVIMNNRTF